MAKFEDIKRGTQSQIKNLTIENDVGYEIKDQPHTSITAEQMATQHPANGGFYSIGEVFYCLSGAMAGKFVMWTGIDWIDLGKLVKAGDYEAFEKIANKVTSISSSSTNTQYPSALAVYNYSEAKVNKKTTITASSTDTDYPTSKAVYGYGQANFGLEVEEA